MGFFSQLKSNLESKQNNSIASAKSWFDNDTSSGNSVSSNIFGAASKIGSTTSNNTASSKWYKGADPTYEEAIARAYQIAETDYDTGMQLVNDLHYLRKDSSSMFYNQYASYTNPAVDELKALGVDVSTLSADLFKTPEMINFMETYLERSSTSDSAKAPTKKSSLNNRKAYWLNQWYTSEADTLNAEKDYQNLLNDVMFLAGDKAHNYSDDDILKSVVGENGQNLKSKYPTIYKMYYNPDDEDKEYVATKLNRALDYSEGALRGAMWAARNPEYDGGLEGAIANSYLGKGNVYKENPEISSKLDPLNPDNTVNPNFHPYSVGSTVAYEDALFFGRYGFDNEWINANQRIKYYGTDEEKKHFANIEIAVANQNATDKAEDAIYDYANYLINHYDNAADVQDKLDKALESGKLYVKTDKNGNVRYSTKSTTGYEEIDLGILNDIDASVGKNVGKENQINPNGKIISLSIGTNYKYDNLVGEIGRSFEEKNAKKKTTEYASNVTTEATTKTPSTAEGIDAVSGADKAYKPGQQDAVIEAQDKTLGESTDIVAPVATESEYAGIKNSWSMAFGMVKNAWDAVSSILKPDSLLMTNLVKNSVGTMTSSILQDSDVVQQYNIYNNKLPELEKEKTELETELGNLAYKRDEAFDYDKWDGKLEDQPAWNTLSDAQKEKLKDYEAVLDVNDLANLFNSEVNNVVVTEEQQERINRYQDVLFYLNEANGYIEQNQETYDAAVKRTEDEKKKTQTVIDMLKRNGVDTTELENAQKMSEFYLNFNQYDPTVWQEYNVYHTYSQIVYSGAGGIDEMLEIARNDDEEIQKYIELAQWSLDYADENNIQLPDNIRENITRWMESMQRQHEDFEYLTVLEADDFSDKVKIGREMADDMYEFDWEAYRNNPSLESQPMWNLLSDEQKQSLLQMQEIYDINDVANQFTTYMNDMDIENGLFGSYRLSDLLTDYEADTFYYLLATEGLEGAMTYKDHLTDSSYGVLNSRAATKTREKADELASSGFFGRRAADVLSMLLSPVAAVQSFVYTADYALKKLRGERVEYNPDSIDLSANIYKKEARQKITEEIDRVYGKDTVLGKVMRGLQEIISNRGDSMVNMIAFGPLFNGISNEILQEFLGALPMSVAAATDAVADAKAKGANDTQLLGIYLSTLLSESVTEAISISNMRDAFKMGIGNASASDVVSFLKNWLTNSGVSEMVGETINDVVENLAADLWTPESSEYKELVAHYINDEHMTEEEARDMAGKDMMMGLLHTALISYLSPGMDIVSYSAGRLQGRASMTKEYQQRGYNDVNIFNVMNYDKQRRQNEVEALRTLINENQNVAGEEMATTQNAESSVQGANVVSPDTGAVEAVQNVPQTQGNIQTINAPQNTGEAVNETVSVDRYTADYTALDSATQADTASQTATIASVLDTEKTNESGDMATAAAERLDTLPGGENRIELMTDLVVGAEESGTDIALVKQAVINAVLGGEGSAAWQMMNSSDYIHADLGQKAVLLASTVEQDAANASVQESMVKAVHESRVNSVERELIANGALKGTQKAQESLDKAENAAAEARTALEERQQALAEATADVEQKAQAVADNPTDDNMKQHMDAVTRMDNADESRKQYEQHMNNTEQDRSRAEAEFNRIRNEEMTAVRKQAEETVALQDQQRANDAAALAEQQRQQAADQAEAERQQKIADNRSGKTAEESARAKIQRLAESKGYTGKQAEQFVNDVMNYWQTGQVNKVDLSKQFSKSEGYLMMGALSRRFGVNVDIADIATGENGYYDPNTNTITLNKNLPAGQVLVEFALHELTHSLESTGSYKQYSDTVLNVLFPSEAELNDAVAKKLTEYEDAGRPLVNDKNGTADEKAKREIVAEFTRLRLNDKAMVQRMVDAGMGGRIRNALHNVNQFLKNIKLTGEARTEAENLRRTERMFQKAIRERAREQAKANKTATAENNVVMNPNGAVRLTDWFANSNEGQERDIVGVEFTDDDTLYVTSDGEKISRDHFEGGANGDGGANNAEFGEWVTNEAEKYQQENNAKKAKPFVRASENVSGDTKFIKMPDGSVKSYSNTANDIARDVNKTYKTNISNSNISSEIQKARNLFIHGDAEGAVNAVFELAKNVESAIGLSRNSLKPSALAQGLNDYFGNKYIPISESDSKALVSVYGSIAKANRVLADAGVKARLRLDKNNNNTGLRLDDVFRNNDHVTAEGQGFDISQALGGVDTARWEDILYELEHQRETYVNQVRDEYTNGGSVSAEDLQAEIHAMIWNQVANYSDVSVDENNKIQVNGNNEFSNTETETDWGIDEDDRAFSTNESELTDAQKAEALREAGVDYENAVARGDMKAAQEDVDFYAEQSGYTLAVFHGTGDEFNEFNRGYEGIHLGDWNQASQMAAMRKGVFGNENANVKKLYARINKPFVINGDIGTWTPRNIADVLLERNSGGTNYGYYGNSVDISGSDIHLTGEQLDQIIDIANSADYDVTEEQWDTIASVLEQNGYDGIKYLNQYESDRNSYSYIALRPNDVKSADPVTYDDNGNVIPLDQRFSDSSDIRYSVGNGQLTDAQKEQMLKEADVEYENAVANGDTKTAQQMVDEAAMAAFPNSVLIQNGKFRKMWHHTNAEFTEFLPGVSETSIMGKGIYFTPNEYSMTANFGAKHKAYYLNIQNWKLTTGNKEGAMYFDMLRERQKGITDREEIARINREFREETGIDAFLDWQNGWWNVLVPELIKSADPVTYDDNGNVIPLSERFDIQNPDYRYSVKNDQMTDAERNQALIDAGLMTQEELMAQENLLGYPAEGGEAQRQFGYETAQESNALHDEVKQYLYTHSNYMPDTNQGQVNRAIGWVQSKATESDPDGYYAALDEIASDTFDYRSADGQARMLTVMSMAALKAENGKTAEERRNALNDELRIADAYNKQGTDLGRALQARKIFRLMTPLGRVAALQGMADRINEDYGKKGIKNRVGLSEWTLKAASEAQTEEDFQKVQDAAAKELAEQMPVSWKERLNALRMLSMLGNPRTHIRNIIGNALFVPAVSLKNKLGAVVELGMDKGDRTKTLALAISKEIRDFARQDAETMKDTLTGTAKYNEDSKIQMERKIFGTGDGILSKTVGNFIQTLSDFNSNALEGEDWFFLKGHYRRALGGWIQANGYSVDEVKSNPDLLEKGRQYAIEEAQKATYRDFNEMAKRLNDATRDAKTVWGKSLAFGVNAVLPFKKTPANILRRGLEYSPLGIAKSLTADAFHLHQYNEYQKGNLEVLPESAISPNQFIDKLCSGLTGSAIMAVGFLLAGSGAVTCGLDDDDDEFEKLKGGQEYSVNLGKLGNMVTEGLFKAKLFGEDVTFTMDWAAPMSMPFFVGAALREQVDGEGVTDIDGVLNAIFSIGEPLTNLSMLDGLNSVFRTSQNSDAITQVGAKIVSNYLTSFIPSAVGAVARSFDPIRRKSFVESGKGSGPAGIFRSSIEQSKNKIPGMSMNSIPVMDAFGNVEETGTVERILENFVLPGYLNSYKNDPVIDELERLYGMVDESKKSGMVPKMPQKTIGNGKVVLSAEQYDQLTEERGKTAHALIEQLMSNRYYQQVSDDDKATMINDVWTYATQNANYNISKDANVDTWVLNSRANPIQGIVNRQKARVDTEYKEGYKEAAVESVRNQNWDDLDVCIEKLEEAGVKDPEGSIKTAVGNAFKAQYIRAYQEDDSITMDEIETLLIDSGLGFDSVNKKGQSTFDIWIEDMNDQVLSEEEEE